MQILKEEVKQKIMSAALQEFGDMGYADASMRVIAKKSCITAGNIYHYFESKDALFNTIMEPVGRQMMELVHADGAAGNEATRKLLSVESIMEKIMALCRHHSAELLILVYKSKGSKFEGIKEELCAQTAQRLAGELLAGLSAMDGQKGVALLSNAIATAFIEGVFVILRDSFGDAGQVELGIRRLLVFFFNRQEGYYE